MQVTCFIAMWNTTPAFWSKQDHSFCRCFLYLGIDKFLNCCLRAHILGQIGTSVCNIFTLSHLPTGDGFWRNAPLYLNAGSTGKYLLLVILSGLLPFVMVCKVTFLFLTLTVVSQESS